MPLLLQTAPAFQHRPLRIDREGVSRSEFNVCPARAEIAALDIVAQMHGQDRIHYLPSYFGRLHGKETFYPAIQIARHEVGAAEVQFLVTAVSEVKGARVLQETPDYARHPDVLTQILDPGPETADAAHLQVDSDPGAGGLVERVDALLVGDGVELEYQSSAAIFGVTVYLAVYPRYYLAPEGMRRDQQFPVFLLRRVAGEHVEKI
jgi:hypothetical protein